eukprot:scaffold912_cov422-Prasinococcus_capsulatus_cf.AAC.14
MHVRSQQLAQHVMVPRSAGAGARGSLTNPSSVARSFVSTVKGQGTHQQALQALAKRWTPAVRSWTNLQTVQQVYLNSRLRGVATKSFVPTAPPPSASSRAHLQSILKDRCLSTATMTASSAAGRGALATSAAATATFSSPWVTSETARRLVSGWQSASRSAVGGAGRGHTADALRSIDDGLEVHWGAVARHTTGVAA